MEQKGIEVLGTDSEGSNSSVSWRNIGDCNNSTGSTKQHAVSFISNVSLFLFLLIVLVFDSGKQELMF